MIPFLLSLVANVDTAAAVVDEHAGGGLKEALLKPDLALTLATWITFILLITLLKKFGWGPLTKAIDEREAKIAESVQRAENARNEAEQMLVDYNAKLAAAAVEADQHIKAARVRAEELTNRMAADAQKIAEDITAKAQASIEAERVKVVAELRSIVAESAANLAGRILDEEVDATRHGKLIEGVVSGISFNRKR